MNHHSVAASSVNNGLQKLLFHRVFLCKVCVYDSPLFSDILLWCGFKLVISRVWSLVDTVMYFMVHTVVYLYLFMVALCNRSDHIYFHPVFCSSFFFPHSCQPSQSGCLPYLPIWCGLSANLRCRSETCCTRLWKCMTQKLPPAHHRTTLSGYIFATKARIRQSENSAGQPSRWALAHILVSL